MESGTDEIERKARCMGSGCPNAGKGLEECARCAGPVVWSDSRGVLKGKARSCHNCPNNGLGLPVCWAACPGPNTNFASDGQKMVCMDAAEDPESFLAHESEAETDSFGDSVVEPFAERPEDALRSYSDSVTERLSPEAETACKVVFSTVMSLDEKDLIVFYYLYRNMMPSDIAKRMGISKQAVCNRKDRMTRDNPWMRSFVRSMGLKASSGGGSNRGRFKGTSVVQPDLFVDAVMEELRNDTLKKKLSEG